MEHEGHLSLVAGLPMIAEVETATEGPRTRRRYETAWRKSKCHK